MADYYEIIKHPMCMMDILEKVDTRQYSTAAEFLEDFRLIHSNACEYNPKGNDPLHLVSKVRRPSCCEGWNELAFRMALCDYVMVSMRCV